MSKLVYILPNVSLGCMARNNISGLNDQHAFPGVPWSLPWEFCRFAMADFINGCLNAQMHKLVGRVAYHWLNLHADLILVQDMTWHKAPWSLLLKNLCSVPGHTVSKWGARRSPGCVMWCHTCDVMLQRGQCSPHLPWSWSCLWWSSRVLSLLNPMNTFSDPSPQTNFGHLVGQVQIY